MTKKYLIVFFHFRFFFWDKIENWNISLCFWKCKWKIYWAKAKLPMHLESWVSKISTVQKVFDLAPTFIMCEYLAVSMVGTMISFTFLPFGKLVSVIVLVQRIQLPRPLRWKRREKGKIYLNWKQRLIAKWCFLTS